MRRPFTVVDWRGDCMEALAELIPERTGGAMRDALVIFPHQRPRRHLMRRLAMDDRLHKPLFPPRMESVSDWLPGLRRELDPRPLTTAGPLDRAGLLYEVAAELRREGQGLLADLPLERDRFFPWGVRLADLMEELARHALTPANLVHLGGEVQPMAEALLEQLGSIFERYETAMDERDWTTPGLDARRVAARADEAAELMDGQRVFIVGFYALTGSEEAVFRALWERGAEVVLHSDGSLATPGRTPHWACREHARWRDAWGARAETFSPESDGTFATGRTGPALRFYEGFDLHSQLSALRDELDATGTAETAIVAPDTSCLMPVLHHLPDKDVNISMGYPLSRSSLTRLLETVLRLQETAAAPGRYHWREVIALIRHPYVKMLEPEPGLPIRGLLRELERAVRRGGRHLAPLVWEPDMESLPQGAVPDGADPAAALAAMRGVLAAALTRFEEVNTLEALGMALLHLARTLAPEHGAGMWRRFPIDAECLYRLSASVVPALTGSYISRDRMDAPILFAILRRLLDAERVPFEAEPLTGLQVMGMLESRMLHFPRVMVLDAVDDKLPGTPAYDALLPDPLRQLLGLPDGRHRSLVAAHNFHRLIAGADEARIFYQTGESAPGDKAGKPVRSRFVEQLLWEEEKRLGHIIEPNDGGPLEAVGLPVASVPGADGDVDVTDAVRDKLDGILRRKELSATFLDSYLHCPARFFYERLTPLREPETVSEEGDPLELGIVVHDVLCEFLTPHIGERLDLSTLDPLPLQDAFSERLRERSFFEQMPFDMRMALESSGRRRLWRFLKSSGETTITALEKTSTATIDVGDRILRVGGKFDRVDRRPDGLVVLDYKTGGVHPPAQTLWTDSGLWEAVAFTDSDVDPSTELARRLGSVQLPLYCWLLRKNTGETPHNAAWVELRDAGREVGMFTSKTDEAIRERVTSEYAPALVRFLVRHMLAAERFEARPGPRCAYCPYGHRCPRM